MTIETVLGNVAERIGVSLVTPVFPVTSSKPDNSRLLRIANVVAKKIAMPKYNWTALERDHIITGDGSTVLFDLPDDFDRFITDVKFQYLSDLTRMTQVTNADEWTRNKLYVSGFIYGMWRRRGNQVETYPALSNGRQVQFTYITKNIVCPASGDGKRQFDSESDTFCLDEELLELGMISQWLSDNSLDNRNEEGEFRSRLAALYAEDKPLKTIRMGQPRIAIDGELAYPYTIIP